MIVLHEGYEPEIESWRISVECLRCTDIEQ